MPNDPKILVAEDYTEAKPIANAETLAQDANGSHMVLPIIGDKSHLAIILIIVCDVYATPRRVPACSAFPFCISLMRWRCGVHINVANAIQNGVKPSVSDYSGMVCLDVKPVRSNAPVAKLALLFALPLIFCRSAP